MTNAYKACPVDSVFPQVYGLDGETNDWTYNSFSNAKFDGLSLSFDQEYVVACGYI